MTISDQKLGHKFEVSPSCAKYNQSLLKASTCFGLEYEKV